MDGLPSAQQRELNVETASGAVLDGGRKIPRLRLVERPVPVEPQAAEGATAADRPLAYRVSDATIVAIDPTHFERQPVLAEPGPPPPVVAKVPETAAEIIEAIALAATPPPDVEPAVANADRIASLIREQRHLLEQILVRTSGGGGRDIAARPAEAGAETTSPALHLDAAAELPAASAQGADPGSAAPTIVADEPSLAEALPLMPFDERPPNIIVRAQEEGMIAGTAHDAETVARQAWPGFLTGVILSLVAGAGLYASLAPV